MDSKYSIKELERLTGIKAHTIRVWEQRYDLVCPNRTDTNIRYYCDSDLKRLLNIAVLVNNGMKISKIACMSDAELNSLVLDQAKYKGDFETHINGLKVAMLEFNDVLFDRILTNCLTQYGSEITFSKVVGGFIQQVGILWQTNTISVVHEHFASNLIKQKLYVAIDGASQVHNAQAKTFVLYLPADELHELGLLYLNYVLRNAGHRVLYLGQSVPLDYVKEIVRKVNADALLSLFTTNPCVLDLPSYFESASDLVAERDIKWFIGGNRFEEFDHSDLHPSFIIRKEVPELREVLLQL